MKRIFYLFFILFILAVSSGCKNHSDKGWIVVSNNSCCLITDVYVMQKGGSGYKQVFSGEIDKGESYFIDVAPGEYSVRVAAVSIVGNIGFAGFYETGYNIYKRVEEDGHVYVAFDGEGLYFE